MRSRKCLVWTGINYARTHLSACANNNIDFQVCKQKECEAGTPHFRDHQCSLYNSPRIHGSYGNQWKAVLKADAPCHLVCENDRYQIQRTFGTVLDGTYCYKYGTDMCVNGRCKKVGCDNHLDSVTKKDMCGVCGGRNDTCRRVPGTYKQRLPIPDHDHNGYNEIVQLPVGATELFIKENSKNYLALMSDNNTFLLNGNYKIDWTRMKNVAGTKLFYERLGDKNETLRIVGPTKERLRVMLLYKEHNKGVRYEYWLSNNMSRDSYTTHVPITRREDPNNHLKHINFSNFRRRKSPGHSSIQRYSETTPARPLNTRFNRSTSDTSSSRRNNLFRRPDTSTFLGDTKKHHLKTGTYTKKHKKTAGTCGPCKRTKKRKELICAAAFVSHIKVRSVKTVKKYIRYDVTMRRTYRQTLPLMSREFIWLNKGCRCPKLQRGKEYLVIGFTDMHEMLEVRLNLPPDTYYRNYKDFAGKKMERIIQKINCPKHGR